MEKFILELSGEITTYQDGFEIKGKQNLKSGNVDTFNDHRIAMTAVVANICLNSGIKADNIECINDSYPSFFDDLIKILKVEMEKTFKNETNSAFNLKIVNGDSRKYGIEDRA